MQQRIHAVTDYFIHPSLRADADSLHRARILVAVMLSFLILTLIGYFVGLSTRFLPQPVPMTYGGVICLPTVAWLIGLLVLSRRKGEFLVCSIGVVSALLIAVVAGIAVSGGPTLSPVMQLLVLPPLTAYFFGGLRWGKYAVAASFASLLTLFALHAAGVGFLHAVGDGEQMETARLLVGSLNLFAISAMGFIYESTAVALKQERNIEHEKYIRLAQTDALTGLSNRRSFDALLEERIKVYGAQHPSRRFALGYLDLDGFKPINDRYGHAVGDEVLRVIAARLQAVLREADLVGRHGGDEFMLLLDAVGDAAGLEGMAQRILASIAQPIDTSAGTVGVSGSLGIAIFPNDSAEIETLKKYADAAMYAAKKQRGCWRLYQAGR